MKWEHVNDDLYLYIRVSDRYPVGSVRRIKDRWSAYSYERSTEIVRGVFLNEALALLETHWADGSARWWR